MSNVETHSGGGLLNGSMPGIELQALKSSVHAKAVRVVAPEPDIGLPCRELSPGLLKIKTTLANNR